MPFEIKRIASDKLKFIWSDLCVVFRYWKDIIKQGNSHLFFNGIRNTKTLLRCHHALFALPEIYHPLLVPGFTDIKAKRPCKDRLRLIINDMEDIPAKVNDIGCQIGFFSFSLAERGYSVTGYDMNKQNILICRMLNELNNCPTKPAFKNTAFMPETIDAFSSADYTLCLAVFHHIIYYHGLSVAQKLIAVLRNKTRKRLYFEIGQSNEPVEPWAKHLPDMGPDPLVWITDFLRSGGFKNVEVLGLVPTHVSNVPRYLVAASP